MHLIGPKLNQMQYRTLFKFICNAIGDEDMDIANNIIKAIQILGCNYDMESWMYDGLNELQIKNNTHRACVLATMSYLLDSHEHGIEDDNALRYFVNGLNNLKLWENENSVIKEQLKSVIEKLMMLIGAKCETMEFELLNVILRLIEDPVEASNDTSVNVLIQALQMPNVHSFIHKYIKQIINVIKNDINTWTGTSPNLSLFRCLLHLSNDIILIEFFDEIVIQMTHLCVQDTKRDPVLRCLNFMLFKI